VGSISLCNLRCKKITFQDGTKIHIVTCEITFVSYAKIYEKQEDVFHPIFFSVSFSSVIVGLGLTA
jgi:hypothetical protein